jgi:hypothetical protein
MKHWVMKKKSSLICFRADQELHDSLVRIAKEEQRSLSSTIEMALINYVTEKKAYRGIEKEKRQYPRKSLSVPAMINKQDPVRTEIGAVTEISLCGLRVLIPKDFNYKTMIDTQGVRFEIIFALPAGNRPIKLSCESKSAVDSQDGIHVGAAFVDADFQSYRSLQSYLM